MLQRKEESVPENSSILVSTGRSEPETTTKTASDPEKKVEPEPHSDSDAVIAKTSYCQSQQSDYDNPSDHFRHQPISEALADFMRRGGSLTDQTPVGIEDLAHLIILYVDFAGETQIGELIVHQALADEVLEIFAELYAADFPIASVMLIDHFQADDEKSMAANNSYAFSTRPILGRTEGFSRHSYGIAIDINPVQNPYVRDGLVLPSAGKAYLDRQDIRPGMIVPGSLVYGAFISRGWTWGGNWRSLQDYHHFEKNLNQVADP